MMPIAIGSQGSETTLMTVDEDAGHAGLLARVAQNGDRDAFAALFSHFAPRIKTIMRKGGADDALAEDLAQEAMLTVWRKAALFDSGRGSAAGWIFTIARNLRIDRLRGQPAQPFFDIEGLELTADGMDGEAAAHDSFVGAKVKAAIESLPENQRAVVRLCFIEDLAHGPIAQKLGIPVGTVKSRLRLAYERLRSELETLK